MEPGEGRFGEVRNHPSQLWVSDHELFSDGSQKLSLKTTKLKIAILQKCAFGKSIVAAISTKDAVIPSMQILSKVNLRRVEQNF